MAYESETVPDDSTAFSRRHLLAVTASGVALGASGLFLPGVTEDSLARGGSNDGELGGRRGKNHRGRDNHRHHREQKDRNKKGKDGEPGSGLRLIEFVVSYAGSAASIKIKAYSVLVDPEIWTKVDERDVARNSGATFSVRDLTAGLWIADRYVVKGQNPLGYPTVTLGYGGTVKEKGPWVGGTAVVYRGLSENEVAPAMSIDGYTFEAQRLVDSDDYKRFKITIT